MVPLPGGGARRACDIPAINGCLDDRVALVTGSSVGPGREIARSLAADGAHVYLCARTESDLRSAVDAIRSQGGRAEAVVVDLMDRPDVDTVALHLARDVGRLDILVNNAGGPNPFGGWDELSDDDWERTFECNFFSPMRLMRSCVPLLRASGYGRIITIGSTSALEPNRYNPHYAAAKSALHNLSKYLATQLATDRITVNLIAPATLESRSRDLNMERRSKKEDVPLQEIQRMTIANELSKIPLGRIGTGEDVASLVSFLASDAAAWITGSTIVLDGGSSKFAW